MLFSKATHRVSFVARATNMVPLMGSSIDVHITLPLPLGATTINPADAEEPQHWKAPRDQATRRGGVGRSETMDLKTVYSKFPAGRGVGPVADHEIVEDFVRKVI